MKKTYYVSIIGILAMLLTCSPIMGQSISGIINKYSRVMSIDSCQSKLGIEDTIGFGIGTRIILIQMKGGTIQEPNSAAFGTVSDMQSVGKYEINIVDSIAGNAIFLRFRIKNTYQTTGNVQIVTYPTLNNVTVTDTLRAAAWDGAKGGIIAFEANSLTLNAPINASGAGFRGGAIKQYSNCDALEAYNNYYYPLSSTTKANGAPKGEGIAAIIENKECGRGAQANGGGGGNNHKSGGGGGGHLTAGGGGGQQRHVNVIRNCIGDYAGFGGLGITSNGNDRLYFGGGGGAGHNRENSNSKGGNGGGIIIIKTNVLNGNAKSIVANGDSAAYCTGDGAGGGGAGGTILLMSTTNNNTINLNAKGGNGGISASISEYDFGPGGGGAGGRIAYTTSTGIVASLTGGNAGTNAVQRNLQGAVKGTDGSVQNAPNFILTTAMDTIYRNITITQQPTTIEVCQNRSTVLSIRVKGNFLTYAWEVNRGTGLGFVPLSSDTTFSGINTNTLTISRVQTNLNPYLFRCVITNNCAIPRQIIKTDSIGLIIIPTPIAAFTATITGNSVSFINGSSNATGYLWDFGNGQTSTQSNPVYNYPVQGNYDVILKAINSCDTIIYRLTVRLNAPPRAGFTSTSSDYCIPANVQFTNSSSTNTTSYRWILTGGSPAISTDRDPLVVYSTAGIYDVKLIVSNAYGSDTILRTAYVRVNAPPTTRFTTQQTGANSTVIFNSSQTIGATTYAWSFGDGTTATEPNPQHMYRNAGTYVVSLSATNICGTSVFRDTLTLLSLPSASISVNQSQGCAPITVQFSGQNASNVTGWSWSFPGGVPATSTLRNPSVRYNMAGIYDVSLTVSNTVGIYTTTEDSLIHIDPAPNASFRVKSINAVVVEFENFSTGGTTYRWDFGDGTSYEGYTPPLHTYNRNGIYTVTLQALRQTCAHATAEQVTIFVVPTNDLNTEGGVSMFPNPTNGKMTLDFKYPLSADVRVIALNATGQIVKNWTLSREAVQELDFSPFSDGIYLLQFISNQTSFIKKIIKM